jgi:hypothetical protein
MQISGFKELLRRLLDKQDSNGNSSFNTVFGDIVAVERHADIEEQFNYNVNTKTLTTTTNNGGSADIDSDMLLM